MIKKTADKHISAIAYRILEGDPDPVVRWRLLRDVLGMKPASPQLGQARANLARCEHVLALKAGQRPDGGWGRFHSRDSTRRRKFPTTEFAVERALALGMDTSDPVLQKAVVHIESLLEETSLFPDPPERNDRWSLGVRLFLAATLARLLPRHPLLDHERALWLEILGRTFHTGRYEPLAEISAHADLTGVSVSGTFMMINSRYHLSLLGSSGALLPTEIETAWLQWLWERPQGIGYFGIPLNRQPPPRPGPLDRWLASLELFSQATPKWACLAGEAITWLWKQRGDGGLWDLGARSVSSAFLPLSASWRRRQNRAIDWSTRIMILLNRYELDRARIGPD
jgi:hypothetical protein